MDLVHTVLMVKGQSKRGHRANHISTFKVSIQIWYIEHPLTFYCQSKSHAKPEVNGVGKHSEALRGNKILYKMHSSTVGIVGIMYTDQILPSISSWRGKRNQRVKKGSSLKVVRGIEEREPE